VSDETMRGGEETLAPVTCAKCGYTEVPTPWFDFYHCSPGVWPNADEELCESCFRSECARYIRESKQ
jgi:hypothetical protein